MAQAIPNFSFDANSVAPSTGAGKKFPVGVHPAVITAVELKPTKSEPGKPQGGMLVFTMQITDGPAKGSEGDYRLNVYHPNEQTVKIAYAQLSTLMHVTGVPQVNQDFTPMFFKPFIITVAPQAENPDKYTEVTKVQYIDGSDVQQGKYWPHGAGNNASAGAFQPPAQQPQQQQPQQFQQPPQQQAAPQGNAAAWGAQQPQQQPQQPAQQQAAPAGWQPGAQQPAAPAAAPGWQPNANPAQGAAGGAAPAWAPAGGTAGAAPAWGQPR